MHRDLFPSYFQTIFFPKSNLQPVAVNKSNPRRHVSLIGATQTMCRSVCVPTLIGKLCTSWPCTGSSPIPVNTQMRPRSFCWKIMEKRSFCTRVTIAALSMTASVVWPFNIVITVAVKLRWLGSDTSRTSYWRPTSNRAKLSMPMQLALCSLTSWVGLANVQENG